jgi:hypothetical protein
MDINTAAIGFDGIFLNFDDDQYSQQNYTV